MDDIWIALSAVGITDEDFVVVVSVAGDPRKYLFYPKEKA